MTTTVSACPNCGGYLREWFDHQVSTGFKCDNPNCAYESKELPIRPPAETVIKTETVSDCCGAEISYYTKPPRFSVKHPRCSKCKKDSNPNPPTETDKTKQCFCQSIYNGETNTVDNCTCGKCVDAIANHTETVKNCKKCYEEKNYGICPHNHSTETVSECRCVCHTDKPWLSPHSSERCLCQKLTPIGPMVKKWEEKYV